MSWWQQRGPPRNYVEVKVAGVDLRGRRLDPFAVLFAKDGNNGWVETQRTETVWEDNNPAFVESFEVPYIEKEDRFRALRVAVYNKTSKSNELKRNLLIGSAEFTLDRMLCKKDGIIERMLQDKKGKSHVSGGSDQKNFTARLGYLILCGEEIERRAVPHMYSIQLGFEKWSGAWGWNIQKIEKDKGIVGYASDRGKRKSIRSDFGDGKRLSSRKSNRRMKTPQKLFYVIYRAILNGVVDADWAPVYRSEILDPAATPDIPVSFEGASLSAERLYGSDENRGLRFELFHFNESGAHRALGFVQTSAAAFRYAKPGGKLFMVPRNAEMGDGSENGTVAYGGMILKSAVVNLQLLKNGLTTRKGGISSLFVFRATDFRWKEMGRDERSREERERYNNWVDRDSYGRKVTVFSEEEARQIVPRGFGYTGSRLKIIESQKQLQGLDDSPFVEDIDSVEQHADKKQDSMHSQRHVLQNT